MDVNEKMYKTVELAKNALRKGEMPIAACIFIGDELISEAHTSDKADRRFLVHAEQKALMMADELRYSISLRKQMQLFTTLEPCLMCYGCALSFFLGEIYFALKATEDGVSALIDLSNIKSQFILAQMPKMNGGIMKTETKQLFIEYLAISDQDDLRNLVRGIINGN